jgi:hypothetical protein
MGQPPWGNGNGSRDASLVALSLWAKCDTSGVSNLCTRSQQSAFLN